MFDRRLTLEALPARGALATSIALGFLGGILAVSQAWFISISIDRVFLGSARLTQVAPGLLAALGVMIVRAVATWGGEVAANRVALRVKLNLRETVFAHLLALGPAYARGERTGELTAAVVEGVEALDAYFSQYLPQLAVAALVPLTVLCVVFPLDALTGLVLVLTAPLIPVFMVLIGETTDALTRKQYDRLGRLSAHFLDTLQGLTTLKLLGQSRQQAQAVGRVSDQYRQATLEVLKIAFLSALVLEIVATISTAIVAVEIGLRLLYGQMAFQPALLILILAPEFYLPLRMLGLRFHAAAGGVSAAKRLFEILAVPLPPMTAPGPLAPTIASPDSQARPEWGSIAFRDVHFSYPDGRPALHGVSFDIPVGQKTALVGPSGAGKSTIAQLLLRFVEPEQGAILVAGRPLHEIDRRAWRNGIAWVPQTPHLFHDTVAANLRLARPEATDEEVTQAARQARLHDFILSLPQGYGTVVGEDGARLSGGQAQRLAMARAFLRDAPFLIVDEPTSRVDPELEALLQEVTEDLVRGRTTLVIAHRLNTVFQADEIIVLMEGKVVERGSHGKLARQRGQYYQLLTAGIP
jgi:ATP-binding cassette, subfamily C, bacterial CydD